jgi:uncharacterized repeat protein (TIGR01451 family)
MDKRAMSMEEICPSPVRRWAFCFFGDNMVFEHIKSSFMASGLPQRITIPISWPVRSLVLTFCLLSIHTSAFSAPLCAQPGKDGPASPSGIINTYYPGTSLNVSSGVTSIPVGAPSGDTSKSISSGDMLLVIQMQDADIRSVNTSNYGSNSGTGSGYTALNQTGVYEYVLATGPVSVGSVPINNGLVNSYRSRDATRTNGQSTYQVVRVPQYSPGTVSGTVRALPWDGSVGGVVAMDVAGSLTISGTITADGAGFRGGWGESSTTSGPNTDYRTRATILGNGMKGEGIAGTPNRMNQPTSFNGIPNQVTSGASLGYPNGTNTDASKGRGAPGNAGGGGTDGNNANDQNSGGGGGGNYAAGAKGGNSWSSNLTVGGEGGSAVTGLAFNRVVMGGGGGAGTTNNATSDNMTYANPPGIACTETTGGCSSGAPGGGIVLIRANSVNGGTITANGGSAYNTGNDSAGGGGAGGSVVLDTQAGGSVTVTANGGDGGNAWRSQAPGGYPGQRHGPGGAGSGGFIAYSPATGFNVLASVDPGTSGMTTTANDNYGSSSSAGGIYTFLSPNATGPMTGAACSPQLTVAKYASAPAVIPGQVVTYSVLVTNTGTGASTTVVAQDQLSPYVSWGINSYGAGVPFQLTNGNPASGLTIGTPVYSNNNGATWTYVPISGGGGAPAGFDANVTNWRTPMTGTMNANGANFTINYKVRVK